MVNGEEIQMKRQALSQVIQGLEWQIKSLIWEWWCIPQNAQKYQAGDFLLSSRLACVCCEFQVNQISIVRACLKKKR